MLIGQRRPRIALITAGGTPDKDYGTGAGVLDLHISTPYAPARLAAVLGERVSVYHLEAMRKDSLHMNDMDRAMIAVLCRKLLETAVIITHGTDTMHLTAEELHKAGLGRTIVLTGALRPAVMRDTDVDINLGMAIGAALLAPPGVYIAMNGLAPWHLVVKDPKSGRFVFRDE